MGTEFGLTNSQREEAFFLMCPVIIIAVKEDLEVEKISKVFTPEGTRQLQTEQQTHLQRPSRAPEERTVLQLS